MSQLILDKSLELVTCFAIQRSSASSTAETCRV
jgi:hypothetical protein